MPISNYQRFSRRRFVEGAAALLALGAVSGTIGCSPHQESVKSNEVTQKSEPPDQIFECVCRSNCMQICPIRVHVRDGKIVRTSANMAIPDQRYARICLKGLTHAERLYSNERLKYPMKRVGERGSGEWERIGWDEAYKTIFDTWNDLVEKYGSTALAASTYAGNYGANRDVSERIANALGMVIVQSFYDMNMDNALDQSIGHDLSTFWHANPPHSMVGNTKNIYIWAVNYCNSQLQNYHFVNEARQAGAKVTVIDPVWAQSCQLADEYIQIRPATDTVLANAMAKIIIESGWTDEEFLKFRSVAPFILKDDGRFLRLSDLGKAKPESDDDKIVAMEQDGSLVDAADAKNPRIENLDDIEGLAYITAYEKTVAFLADYTLDFAEEITGVPQDVISSLANEYATGGPATILIGWGNDRFLNGHSFPQSCALIAALTGQIGRVGASIGDNNGWGTITPDYSAPNGNTCIKTAACHAPQCFESGKIFDTEIYPHSFFLQGNLLGNYPNPNLFEKMLLDMDLLVWHGSRMNDTSRICDILLPATSWFEEEDCVSGGGHPFVMYSEKAIEPYFESRTDYAVWRAIAENFNLGDQIPETSEGWLRDAVASTKHLKEQGVDFDAFREAKFGRLYDDDYVWGSTEGANFPTETGRVQFYVENFKTSGFTPVDQFDGTKYRLPKWEPPCEAWPETIRDYPANPLVEKYPFYCFEAHTKYHSQTQWSHVSTVLELEQGPYVWMNPQDAMALGIEDGVMTRIYNDRGEAILPVRFNEGIAPGILVAPRGYQRDQYPVESSVQTLSHEICSDVADNPSLFDKLVAIEVYTGGVA